MNRHRANAHALSMTTETTTAVAPRLLTARDPERSWREPSAEGCIVMSRATYPLKLPRPIKDAAAMPAKEDGVSLNQWIASAVA